MSALHDLSVAQLAARLAASEVSSVEVTRHFLARIQAEDGLGAFLATDADTSLAQARAADARLAAGERTPLLGVPLGIWAGLKPQALSTRGIMTGSVLGFSLPSFWVGLMLIMVFAVYLGWLPSGGRGQTIWLGRLDLSFLTMDGLQHLILPACTIAMAKGALIIRVTRAATREALPMDYIKFARAKGLAWSRILRVHLLKNIMIPIVTVLGLEFGQVVAFAVVTETIFAWPGMGKLLLDSIITLDRPVVVAYLILIVFFLVMLNLATDILYSVLDPRVRLQAAKA